jgi:signal transduction histidine kinase
MASRPRMVLRRAQTALEQLFSGLGTALVAFGVLVFALVTAVLSLVGIGLPLVPTVLSLVRGVADRERRRLGRWGAELVSPGRVPAGIRAALADPTVRRELAWLSFHGTIGLLIGLISLISLLFAVRDLTFPLLYSVTPPGATATSIGLGTADSWSVALAVPLLELVWVPVLLFVSPVLAKAQTAPGRRLLVPDARLDLSLRVAELTATRAAALDAHAAELRRIERSLHDGSQNRLVAVTILLGAARRAMTRDPESALAMLDKAQDAAEQALADLRTVSRTILPPVLADRGLEGALTGLATTCGVPCQVRVEVSVRCAASTEATAYFVVAEALTNVTKHSGASRASVDVHRHGDRLYVRVTDDGEGGADAADSAALAGTGLIGIRRRVEAHDGGLILHSPRGGPTTMEVELPCG